MLHRLWPTGGVAVTGAGAVATTLARRQRLHRRRPSWPEKRSNHDPARSAPSHTATTAMTAAIGSVHDQRGGDIAKIPNLDMHRC